MSEDFDISSLPDGDGGMSFAATSQKGAIVEEGARRERARLKGTETDRIDEHREIRRTDPHVREAVETLLDWVCGDGYNFSPRNIEGTEITQTPEEVGKMRELFQGSGFWSELVEFADVAFTDGHAFMELVVENDTFKPRVLPTKRMMKKTDEFGNPEQYALLQPDSTTAPGNVDEFPDEAETYENHEIAELTFWKSPGESLGNGIIEGIKEQADILRDMEIDYARFVATKAYPPIIWNCGTQEEKWTESQIEGWLEEVETIEPDSMIAAPHDVDHDVVGVTSTSSSAGAMRLEETFKHFENRIVTGLGVPAILMNMESDADGASVMPSFKRRIKRLRNIIKEVVENQILRSVLNNSMEAGGDVVPEFEFGEHSSAEKRLEVDKLIKLYQAGFLTRKAFAERAGIDSETELPEGEELSRIVEITSKLAGKGDNIQNPDGGSPTDTGSGAESSGGEVTSRQSPEDVDEDSRNRKAPTEDEDA
jgi:hypothetical protein